MIKRVDVKWQREKVVLRVRHSRGVSLIIAIFFVSAFLLVMGGLFEASSRAIESVRNREIEAKLYYLAESASEMASYRAANDGVGANIGADDAGPAAATAYSAFLAPLVTLADSIGISCTDIDPDPDRDRPCVSFEVRGRAAESERVRIGGGTTSTAYYSVPVPGTGDAAAECGIDPGDANDPCNWNKMYLGDSVEIPLFTETASTGDGFTVNPANFSEPGSFKLRIRAPGCDVITGEGSGWCVAGRLVLYPQTTTDTSAPYRNINTDPVLMQWQIADLDGGASLVARDANTSGVRPDPDLSVNPIRDNTELTGGRINAAANPGTLSNFVVLDGAHYGIDSDIQARTINYFVNNYTTKPVLRLNLVGQPRIGIGGPSYELSGAELNDRSLDVPYLEYQLLATSPNISDAKSLVSGSAETSGFRTEFEQYRHRSSTMGGFALESF